MPALKKPKREKLAQELAKGKTATAAMDIAGYSDPRNSTRLTKNEEIQSRVAELQERGAKRVEVTLQSLLEEAEAARILAMTIDQPSAAIAAVREKGVLSGKRVERAETGGPGDFSGKSDAELLQEIAADAAELGLVVPKEYTEH